MTASTLTRDQRRSRRIRVVRSASIDTRRLSKRSLEEGRAEYPETEYWRPLTWGQCVNGPRPCPFVACKHHLFLDINPGTGTIKLNFPDLEPEELADSCALDVADRGGLKLEAVGARLNVTRERIRQIELVALDRLQARLVAAGIVERHHPEET